MTRKQREVEYLKLKKCLILLKKYQIMLDK